MGKLISIAKRIMPAGVFRYFKGRACENVFRKLRKEYPAYRERMLKRVEAVRQKEVINVLFYIWQPSFWKVDSLFRLMLEHPRFNPIICPVETMDTHDPAKRRETLADTRRYFKEKGYPVLEIDGVGPVTGSFVLTGKGVEKIREVFAPDVIFVQTPYESIPESMAADMEHELYCYVPYCYRNSEQHFEYDNATQNKYWFNFAENFAMTELMQSVMTNGGANVICTGHPAADYFLFHERFGCKEEVWKPQPQRVKRIIWAPHWAMHGGSVMRGGVFPDVADRMLKLARTYQGKAQFAFKPHPKLKSELYNWPGWGEERTDAYYNAWDQLPNAQLEKGGYAELFAQSDALVHDSGSFIIEYMMTGKPCCFLHDKDMLPDLINRMSLDCINAHYREETADGVERFLEQVVFAGDDFLQEARKRCVAKYILPPGGKSAADNIIDALLGQGC